MQIKSMKERIRYKSLQVPYGFVSNHSYNKLAYQIRYAAVIRERINVNYSIGLSQNEVGCNITRLQKLHATKGNTVFYAQKITINKK